MHIKSKMRDCVLLFLTSLILLAITTTPATASPVLMFCVRDKRAVKDLELTAVMTETPSNQLNVCRTLTVRQTSDTGAPNIPFGTTGEA